ncbi:MAG: hypothetical protein ACK47B_11760 [Armatimonadota bacterium]
MAKWQVAVLFIACDILIGAALVLWLCTRDYTSTESVEWALHRKRRRRWYFWATLLALAYLSLGPGFLTLWLYLFNTHRLK